MSAQLDEQRGLVPLYDWSRSVTKKISNNRRIHLFVVLNEFIIIPHITREEDMTAEDISDISMKARRMIVDGDGSPHQFFFSALGVSPECRLKFLNECAPPRDLRAVLQGKRIPRLIHRLWLNDTAAPCMPPESYLKRIEARAEQMNGDCEIILWSNVSEILQEISLSSFGRTISLKNICEFENDPIFLRFNLVISNKKYILADDICNFF